ncbi:MAG: hypothetical protein LWY06_19635 [Firmicutes bacterium]|nr:hypothetical protein [Bacillota bacterium]
MESFLVSYYVYFILALLAGLIISVIAAIRENRKEFSFIKPAVCVLLLIIVLGGVAARFAYTGIAPVVFNDEFLYVATGENISHTGQATPEVYRSYPPEPWSVKKFFPPYPQLWAVLIGIVFKFAGAAYKNAAFLNLVLSSLTPFLIFFAGLFLFKKVLKNNGGMLSQYLGLLAASFWAFLPVAVKLSGCASPETASAFFIALFLAMSFFFRLYPTNKTFLAAVLSLCAVVNVRPENMLYIILFVVFFYAAAKKPGKKAILAGIAILILFASISMMIMASGHFDTERAKVFTIETRPGFENKWQNMGANLVNNLLFFLGKNQINPIFYTIVLCLGIFAAFREKQKWTVRLLLWFAFSWFILSPFPFGDYSNANSSDAFRFSLHMYFPMIMLMAFGVIQLEKIKFIGSNRNAAGIAGILILGLCIISLNLGKPFLSSQALSGRDYERAKEIGMKMRDEKIEAFFISPSPDKCLMMKYATGFPAGLVETQQDIENLKAGNTRLFYYTSQDIPELYLRELQMDVFLRVTDDDEYSVFEVRR